MGVGKSTVARLVCDATGFALADSDPIIEQRHGMNARAYAESYGVGALHALERQVLREMLAARRPSVLTPGASVIDDERSRHLLGRRARVVWLDLATEALRLRMTAGPHRRRLERAELERLDRRRRPLYAAIADLTLDASAPPDALARAIVQKLRLDR